MRPEDIVVGGVYEGGKQRNGLYVRRKIVGRWGDHAIVYKRRKVTGELGEQIPTSVKAFAAWATRRINTEPTGGTR